MTRNIVFCIHKLLTVSVGTMLAVLPQTLQL